jgi:Protein of unknown function (DUF1553)/Protein of unknown function (DUF1549)/Planctomycete cytochrome C
MAKKRIWRYLPVMEGLKTFPQIALRQTRLLRSGLSRIFVLGFWLLGLLSLDARQDGPQQTELVAAAQEFAAEDLEFFESRIRPLLVEHCYECHSGGELNGGLSVESREQLLSGGDSGPALVLGDRAANSLLLEAVSYTSEHLQMPPKNRLSQQQVDLLQQWIQRGAPDPRQPASGAQSRPAPLKGMSLEEGRNFWAFQPVKAPQLPEPQNAAWIQTPIDAYILNKLEQHQLAPAPPADKQTLIRRVTLNLIGVPPTADEVAQFLADQSPQAYANLVERLLASPQYGVRWGRHWLDIARYADSNGLDENLAYGNAWRYRDYVVHSFNTDKPYNRFIVEQIAGDLLPEASQETRTATGFLSLGAKVLAEPDMEKLVMDTIDEQIDAVGKSFLGLTLGCARCHDHKFDPIAQRDYYALAAIFKGTRTFADERFGAIKYWNEHSFSSDQEREQLKAIDAQIAAAKQAAASYKAEAVNKLRAAARQQAADYLMAVAHLPVGASLLEVSAVAEPLKLHPRILFHCRTHLENQQDAGFYQAWHQLKSQPEAVGRHYRELFAQVDAAMEQAQKSEPKTETLADPLLEAARKERLDSAAFLAIPPQPEHAFDEATLSEYYRLMELARVLESSALDISGAMGVVDSSPVSEFPIHIRGSHLNLGERVPRAFPAVMRTSLVEPIFNETSSGRLELAEWLASTTNPLTARVAVNRIWGWHFGRPLVGTTENFGVLGEKPVHPELLDWLARNLMQNGWSIKQLHRTILNSSTYQMSAFHPESASPQALDPENRWLWKFQIQRLDAEQIRDSLLAVSDRLDWQIDGKSVPLRNRQFVFDHTSIDHTKYTSLRRALYLPIIRNNLYTLFEQFDFPDPTMTTGHRNQTTVAPQSLLLMNNELVMDSAAQLAQSLIANYQHPSQRLSELYLRLLARHPTDTERDKCLQYVNDHVSTGRLDAARLSPDVEHQAWVLLVQALVATNDFLYVK